MIPVPCRSEPWKSWFLLSSSKNHLNALKNSIRFWYDNAGFSRLVEVVDMEDLWHLEKNSSKRGNCMAWPTHEDHFQSTCFDMIPVPWRWNTMGKLISPLIIKKNYLNAVKKNIRFWYDNGGFGRLVEIVEKIPQNGETAWPGRLTSTIFSPPFAHRRCQTLRLKPP